MNRIRHAGAAFVLTTGAFLLVGCQQPAQTPSVTAAPATAAPAAATPSPFDGRYRLEFSVVRDTNGNCGPASAVRIMRVEQGRASLMIDPIQRISATGTVGEDGRFRLLADTVAPTTIEGRIEGSQVTATGANRFCEYRVAASQRE
jgi:hypothetical protein